MALERAKIAIREVKIPTSGSNKYVNFRDLMCGKTATSISDALKHINYAYSYPSELQPQYKFLL